MATISGEEWRGMDDGVFYQGDAYSEVLKDARCRIDDIRKSDVCVELRDASGELVRDTDVDVRLASHHFLFGETLWDQNIAFRDGEADDDRHQIWRAHYAELFNAGNNLCYWTERKENNAPTINEDQADWCMDYFDQTLCWMEEHNITPKGHPLFWSIPKCIPQWAKDLGGDGIMAHGLERAERILKRFGDRITIWDLVNEPMWEAAPQHLSERHWPHIESTETVKAYIEPFIEMATAVSPDSTFIINDYGMEEDIAGWDQKICAANDGSTVTAASQRRRLCELMRAFDVAKPQAIGLQSHTGWQDHNRQLAIFDEFAETGYPIHITEFWASIKALRENPSISESALLDMQAEYVANYLTVAFSHASIDTFFFWRFMDDAVVIRDDLSVEYQPVWHAVKDLIQNQWQTRLHTRTDSEGRLTFNGFYGRYDVSFSEERVSITVAP